jgi:hypothetical protein
LISDTMRGRALKGALNGFLDTYVSRFSAHDGYWLFGFLVPELTTESLDLLTPPSDSRPHFRRAIELATAKFREQAAKWKIDVAMLEVAVLTLSRKEAVVLYGRAAWKVSASVDAAIRGRRHWTAERMIVVAPHDPAHERRSAKPARRES